MIYKEGDTLWSNIIVIYVTVGSGGRPETSKSNCLRWTSRLGDVKMSQLS